MLIVEDEEPIAEALAFIIEDAGYAALAAPHGAAGLALALERRPALIITDLMMPRMGGRELIGALRAELESNTPPIIIMTAADTRYTRDAGADHVLKKPFEVEAVEALLHRFLGAQE